MHKFPFISLAVKKKNPDLYKEKLYLKDYSKGHNRRIRGPLQQRKCSDHDIYKHLQGQPVKGFPFLERSKQIWKATSVGRGM